MILVLFGDLHLREERIADCFRALREIRDISVEVKADYVINMGDTFHTRGLIRTVLLQKLYDEWKTWADKGLKQIILVGNHDQEDKKGDIHPLRIFEQFGWTIVDKPTHLAHLRNCTFFPHLPLEDIQLLIDDRAYNGATIFVHWPIQGSKRNDWNVDTDGVPIKLLKRCKLVLSGHYHFRNRVDNVQYVGSPFQQDFAEMGQDKGVMIFDTEKETLTFRELAGFPKHYEIEVFWDEGKRKIKRSQHITGQDFVRAKVIGDSEQVSTVTKDSLMKAIECASLKLDREVNEKSVSRMGLETKEIHNQESLMEKYVQHVETTLDKERLIKVGKEISNG